MDMDIVYNKRGHMVGNGVGVKITGTLDKLGMTDDEYLDDLVKDDLDALGPEYRADIAVSGGWINATYVKRGSRKD